ncbi:MAG: PFL family protein [Chloroflexota bacterium]
MYFGTEEILETIRMVTLEQLDIRTVTLGVNLLDCAHPDAETSARRVYDKVARVGEKLVPTAEAIAAEFGIPIVNKRVAVSPIAWVAACSTTRDYAVFAQALERAAQTVGVDFIGGFASLVHKGVTDSDQFLIASIPPALATTSKVCASVNVASTRAGINMNAVARMGEVIKETAEATREIDSAGCARLVVFANAVEDNPFMAGAFHGTGEAEASLNVGISGPGVVCRVVQQMPEADLGQLAEAIKRTAFKITRMGELVGREVASRLGVPFGIVDLSLAPTPMAGDSVGEILQALGLASVGVPGTTAALALLTDAVKKGGAMGSSYVGGLSGAFIPVSEDAVMSAAAANGSLTIEKLEAMTAVCSVGLDMVAVPGDTSASTLAAMIADLSAIGVINGKTIGVRIIPVVGKKAGDWAEFGGLLGRAPVMPIASANTDASARFVGRGGRVPSPLQSLRN